MMNAVNKRVYYNCIVMACTCQWTYMLAGTVPTATGSFGANELGL